MTPVLQTAVTGFVWAISICLVMAVSSYAFDSFPRRKRNEGADSEIQNDPVKIAYICDCTRSCSSSPNCRINGGSCARTEDLSHAVNFAVISEDGYYVEKDPMPQQYMPQGPGTDIQDEGLA